MSMIRIGFLMVMAAVVASGCGATAPLSPSAESGEAAPPPSHALIYVIHGDGDYLYHRDGTPHRADREALAEAQMVARSASAAEVLIFHQRARRSVLGLFSRASSRFLHYRSGELIADESYRRDPAGLGAEVALLTDRLDPDIRNRTLLYYGHDIPEVASTRYHASFPRHTFGIEHVHDALRQLGADDDPLELIVLSTCNNGSPGTVAALAPFTRYILASPGDLHLSFIDSHPLHQAGAVDGGMDVLAPQLAEWAYRRLADRTRTAITLTLYDTNRLGGFLADVEESYARVRSRLASSGGVVLEDFVDCRDEAMPELTTGMPGVRQWYRPPAFGRQSTKESHSGWGCPVAMGGR